MSLGGLPAGCRTSAVVTPGLQATKTGKQTMQKQRSIPIRPSVLASTDVSACEVEDVQTQNSEGSGS